MKKTVVIGTITTAALAAMLTGGVAASAADCTASAGSGAEFGTWTRSSYTDWQTDPTMPADPDNQDGADNLLNIRQIGAREMATSQATTEDSGWVSEKPAGEGWVQVDRDVVTDQMASDERVLVTPAVPATPDVWANFSPNKDQGPLVGAPSWPTDPRGTWQVHDQLPGGHADEPNGVYQQGEGTAHGSWFYKEVGSPEVPAVYDTVHHDAVTHGVYRYERTTPGVTEYRWVVEERVNTPGADAVLCGAPGDDGETQPPAAGEEQPPAEEPSTPNTPQTTTSQPTTPAVSTPVAHTPRVKGQQAVSVHHRSGAAAAVPTSIDAGL